jgi:serpin B
LKGALASLALLVSACAAGGVAPEPAAAPTARAASVVQGSNAFGVDLYRRLAEERGNVFVSPVSLSSAFGPVLAGARGETAAEIARTLHFPAADDRLHPQQAALLAALTVDREGRRLAVANALWVQRGFRLHPDYLSLTRTHYGAAPEQLDFARSVEAAATINRWAERNTNGRIRNLLGARDVNSATRLVVTNAVHFLGKWERVFDRDATRDEDFHPAGGGTRRLPFMVAGLQLAHFATDDFAAVSLPYQGGEFSMDLFLPRERDGIGAFERSLTPARLEAWLARLDDREPRDVTIAMPKLQLEARYTLRARLQAMGMTVPFTERADFTGMANAPLAIDNVIHQTFLRIDEEGTEAAAATAIGIIVTGSRIPRDPVAFVADHPYFFVIRHRPTGAVVFMGRIEAPEPPPAAAETP